MKTKGILIQKMNKNDELWLGFYPVMPYQQK